MFWDSYYADLPIKTFVSGDKEEFDRATKVVHSALADRSQ